uniref:Uncharacterized protein n=1 Tax=viral metagenome TaxID=1070528 RepID=A0A6M3K9G9_9ZZZZ
MEHGRTTERETEFGLVAFDGRVVEIDASINETWTWANRHGNRWPCSTIASRAIFAIFDPNGLAWMEAQEEMEDDNGALSMLPVDDIDGGEFDAWVADCLRDALPADHACRWLVG